MSLSLTNLVYSEKDIGATIKLSKRQFVWEFDLNGSSQRIELLDSRFTRKKRLYKNGVNILNTTEEGNFIHNFEIDGHACVIIQYGDKIELRIDNQSFTHLYNLQKNKQMFAGEKGPTSNIYVAKPYNSFGSSEQQNNQNGSAFYKVSKPEEENKPKLFNFEIKKNTGNKSHGFNSKFKFGNKEQTSSSGSNKNINNFNIQNKNDNNNDTNNLNMNNNNNGTIDLLGFQDSNNNNDMNNNNNNNNNNVNNNNVNNNNDNNNNLLDFGLNNNNSNVNTQNNQNNQNQPKSGNDIFDLFGNNNNNKNTNNQNSNNNNQFNNIFLAISDGTNQQPKFDQNNLDFMGLNNNMNMNNMNMNNNDMNNMMNNNSNNFQNQNQNNNSNNNTQNQQNNTLNLDLLNF